MSASDTFGLDTKSARALRAEVSEFGVAAETFSIRQPGGVANAGAATVSAAMVGDSEIDMEAAQLLNIRAIGVSFGIRDAADLRALGAETVVDHLSELGPALGASPRPIAMAASAPTLSLRV